MIDIHTHILPGMDDGSPDTQVSVQMLRAQMQSGVDRVYLTPHYYCDSEGLDSFLQRRMAALEKLLDVWDHDSMPQLKVGAEVRYSPALMDLDIQKLTLAGSCYILLELPFHHYPAHVKRIVQSFALRGFVPILAHVERYVYFRQEPQLLLDLVERGAYGQVNVSSLLSRSDKGFALSCLEHSLAAFAASDTHSMDKRPPNLARLPKAVPGWLLSRIEKFSEEVWNDGDLPILSPSVVEKGLLRFK